MPGLFDGSKLEQPVTCPACGKNTGECACPRDASGALCPPSDQPARVHREKRRGKWVTVVTGLDPAASDLKQLAKQFKAQCSAGGTATADGVELQGDHRDTIVQALCAMGYPAKASGG